MKVKSFFLVLVTFYLCQISAYADSIEFNKNAIHTVDSEIEFLFEDTSDLIQRISESPFVELTVTNFMGGPITIAPWADFNVIGQSVTIDKDGVYILDFSNLKNNANPNLTGILVSPLLASTSIFNLVIKDTISVTTASPTPEEISTVTENIKAQANGLLGVSFYLPDDIVQRIYNTNENSKCISNACTSVLLEVSDIDEINKIIIEKIKDVSAGKEDPNLVAEVITRPGPILKTVSFTGTKRINNSGKLTISIVAIYPVFIKNLGFPSVDISKINYKLISKKLFMLGDTGGFYFDKPETKNIHSTIVPCITPLVIDIFDDLSVNDDGTVNNKNLFNCASSQYLDISTTRHALFGDLITNQSSPDSMPLITLPPVIDAFNFGSVEESEYVIFFKTNLEGLKGKKLDVLINDAPAAVLLPVPDMTSIVQKISVDFDSKTNGCPSPVSCNNECINEGACCEADSNGNVLKKCSQSLDATVRFCKCQ